MAGPAFDAKTRVALRTGNYSGTHTPVGTPAGVIIQLVSDGETTDLFTAPTYGGVSLSKVGSASVLGTGGTEIGSVFTYHLGSGIPTGPQTVAITTTSINQWSASIVTVTDAGGTTEVDSGITLNQASGANPSMTLATTASTDCFVMAALHNGRAVVGDTTVGADFTQLENEDYGTTCSNTMRRTTNSSGGNVTVNWTMSTDEGHAVAVGIKASAAAGGQPAIKRMGGVQCNAGPFGPVQGAKGW